MANLSEAFGTITMETENKATLETLIAFIEKSGDWDYGDYGMILSDIRIEENNIAKADFSGCGRGSFSATLAYLMENIKRYLSPNHEFVKVLEPKNFKLLIEYTDSECGCMVLYKEKDIIAHEAGTPLETCRFDIAYEEEFDWTWGNRILLHTESLKSLMDSYHENIRYEEPDEWDKEDIENFIIEVESELPELISSLDYNNELHFFQANMWFHTLYQTAKDKIEEWQ